MLCVKGRQFFVCGLSTGGNIFGEAFEFNFHGGMINHFVDIGTHAFGTFCFFTKKACFDTLF